ncbi:MAG: HEAT repeat domain-containing protein [Cyanobacteria bacterium SZAS LIN-3]|nr:HEAT repeat domain-containing protein [Cyanobacteria bacterium SZAS LIN-3]
MSGKRCASILKVSLNLAVALSLASSVGLGLVPGAGTSALAAQYRKSDVDAEIAILRGESSQARKQAAYHLSEMGIDAKPAIPDLIEALHDPIAYGEAASALGKIGPDAKDAVPALVSCLGNTELGYDRCYAATALGNIGQNPDLAVPALQKMVASDDDATIRRLAAMALGDFGVQAKAAVAVLIEAVKKGEPEMRRDAATSIGKIGGTGNDIPALVSLLSDEIDIARLGAVKALGLLGSEAVSAVPKLVELLKDSSEEVRAAAAVSLGEIGPDARAAVPVLKEALKTDRDIVLHETINEALKKIVKRSKSQ